MTVAFEEQAGRVIAVIEAASCGIAMSTPGRGRRHTRTLDGLSDLLQDLALGEGITPVLHRRARPAHRFGALLLVAVAARWPTVAAADASGAFRPHHVTLAHALPLWLGPSWRAWAVDNADLLARGHQLAVVPAADLVAAVPDGKHLHRHRRLLRRHAATEVAEHADYTRFLNAWSAFTTRRYGRPLPDCERAALGGILAMSRCLVRDFVHAGEVIASAVVCLHETSKVAFDLMATWHFRHARLRPGIYSAVYNLADAERHGYRYSLCYGQFPYKDHVLGAARRLTLEELITARAQ